MRNKLGELTSFDQSPIWDIHNKYYKSNGINSWKKGQIPFNITSNSRFAFQNAKVFFESVKNSDLKKIYLLELGAGSGIFAHYFLKELQSICINEKSDIFSRIHYMLTDYSRKNLMDIKDSEVFIEWEKSESLDYYVLDINDLTAIKRIDDSDFKINTKISAFFANYFYCVLPYKMIEKKGQEYFETYFQLYGENTSLENILEKTTNTDYRNTIEIETENKLINLENVLGKNNARFLKEITKDKNDFALDYSLLSLNSLEDLAGLLEANGLIFISDKSYNNLDDYFVKPVEKIMHYNSISYTANFPLFNAFIQSLGLDSYVSSSDYKFKTLIIGKNIAENVKSEFNELFIENNFNVELIEEYKKGHELLRKNEVIKAIEIFEKCYKYLPEDVWLINTLSSSYLAVFQIEKSLNISLKGYQLDTFKFFDFSLIIAFVYLNIGDYKKAKEFLLISIREHGFKDESSKALDICNRQLMSF